MIKSPPPGKGPPDGGVASIRASHPADAAAPGTAAPEPPGRSSWASAPAAAGPPPRSAGTVAFAKYVMGEIVRDDVMGQAAKVAYYAFMALPPAIMALFALAGLFRSDWLAGWIEANASLTLPEAVVDEIIRPFIQQVVLNEAPGPLSVGLLLALWGASGVFSGLMDSLNVAYHARETRSFLKRKAIALGTMLGGALLFLLAAVMLLAGPEIARVAGLMGGAGLVWNVVRWPVTFAFVALAFWIGYYVLPNRDQRGCKKVLARVACAAAALWLAATAVFRVYIANFSSYTETYGFLGAFIILLLWLWVTGLVVLAGGELAAALENRAS